MRFLRRYAAAGYLGLAVAVACAPAKLAVPAPGVDPALRTLLLDPTADCGRPADEVSSGELQRAYRNLIRTGDAAAAMRVADEAIARDLNRLSAVTLRAEALLVEARVREAADLLQPFAAAAAECLPLALVLGRVQEQVGDLPQAFAAFAAVASRSGAAAERTRAISVHARDMVRDRFSEAMRAGRREAAAWHLSFLERYWTNSESYLQSAMEMAEVTADARSELAAVKALEAFHPKDPALTLRRSQLELQVGDPRTGLALIESLAAAAPADPVLQTELARAKFAWRLLNSPEQVRVLREKVVLSRADFAVLLYWTVPQIRTARPGASQIASDILDHPSRDEIARVANLGLMTIDETLHRFSPDTALRRSDAVLALLRLFTAEARAGNCSLPRSAGREDLCNAGVACGLFDEPLQCVAGGGLSGSEALEMLRRALDRLEAS